MKQSFNNDNIVRYGNTTNTLPISSSSSSSAPSNHINLTNFSKTLAEFSKPSYPKKYMNSEDMFYNNKNNNNDGFASAVWGNEVREEKYPADDMPPIMDEKLKRIKHMIEKIKRWIIQYEVVNTNKNDNTKIGLIDDMYLSLLSIIQSVPISTMLNYNIQTLDSKDKHVFQMLENMDTFVLMILSDYITQLRGNHSKNKDTLYKKIELLHDNLMKGFTNYLSVSKKSNILNRSRKQLHNQAWKKNNISSGGSRKTRKH